MTAQRFAIRSSQGIEKVDARHTSVGSVLSLAIQRALQSGKDGNWTVIEYGNELYRVWEDKGVITIETLTARRHLGGRTL